MLSVLSKRLLFNGLLIILLAFTMASHSRGLWPGDDWFGRAGYFIVRFSIESILFLGCYFLISALPMRLHILLRFFLAFLVSWPLFVLTITMVDIVLGQPEFGEAFFGIRNQLLSEIIEESLWILPKHVSFCCLVALINFRLDFEELFNFRFNLINKNNNDSSINAFTSGVNSSQNLVKKISSKYREAPLRVQAQEHYIKVTTCLGTELIQYKFGQAIEDLRDESGIQVHRSYWVSESNINGWTQHNNNIQLELKFGDSVPVSRRFEQIVKSEFSQL